MTDVPRDDTAYRILRIIRDGGEAGCDLYRFVAAYWPPGARQRDHKPGHQRRGAAGVLQVFVRAGEVHKVSAGPQSRFAIYRLTPRGEERYQRLLAEQLAAAAGAEPSGAPGVRRKPPSEPPPADPSADDWTR